MIRWLKWMKTIIIIKIKQNKQVRVLLKKQDFIPVISFYWQDTRIIDILKNLFTTVWLLPIGSFQEVWFLCTTSVKTWAEETWTQRSLTSVCTYSVEVLNDWSTVRGSRAPTPRAQLVQHRHSSCIISIISSTLVSSPVSLSSLSYSLHSRPLSLLNWG